MKRCIRFKYITLIIALLFIQISSGVVGGGRISFAADTTFSKYSNVLDDLKKDETFNILNYPIKSNDYSLQVIQIAESTTGELFVYVYQPSQRVKLFAATEINMSLSETIDGTKLYGLTLINSSGVFGKYKVNDFEVDSDVLRYYNITSIFREWVEGIDKETGNDNEKNAVAFPVGKRFEAITLDGKVLYHCTEKEVVEIKNPYHDFIRYPNGFKFFPDSSDGHYIAFSTDWDIDRLIEADVYYKSQVILMNNPYGDPVDNTVTLSEIDEASNKADGWFAVKHTWNRIESVKEFIKTETLSPETEAIVKNRQWVLRFCETTYSVFKGTNGLGNFVSRTDISEVSVLRLQFEKDGVIYNLGAVSDKVTGDDKPGNKPPSTAGDKMNFWQWLWNCIVKTFTGAGSWWQIVVTVVTIILAVAVGCLAVVFIRFVITILRGKKK